MLRSKLAQWALVPSLALACSPTPPPSEPWSPRPSYDPGSAPSVSRDPHEPATRASGEPSAEAALGSAPAPAPRPTSDPAETPSCPRGMVLVEGDYGTEGDQTCLSEWWAPQNKKRVCEQFRPPARCVGSKVRKRFCIDTYAWPNVRGVRPEVMNTFYQAQVKCAALGKRMCSEIEWTFACEGAMAPTVRARSRKCNGDHRGGPRMKLVAKRDSPSSRDSGAAYRADRSPTASATSASTTCRATPTRWSPANRTRRSSPA